MKNIVLIGLMGAGKSTISQILSLKLGKEMIDMDDYIEKKYNMSIPEMFEISEGYFREKESECALEISKKQNMIISTGGGIVKNPKNMEVLRESGIVIFIDRPVEHILKDIDVEYRPLLKDNPSKLYDLYNERHELYKLYAHYHLINDQTIEDIVNKILEVV